MWTIFAIIGAGMVFGFGFRIGWELTGLAFRWE